MTQLEKIEKIAERATATIFLNAQWIAHLAETLDDNGLYDDIVRQFVEHARSENRQAFNSINESINELRKQAQADGDKGFNPDWSLPEAAGESLREHMAIIAELRAQLADAISDGVDFRATVADALRELRAEMFNYAPVAAIDATIAKLGLEEQ